MIIPSNVAAPYSPREPVLPGLQASPETGLPLKAVSAVSVKLEEKKLEAGAQPVHAALAEINQTMQMASIGVRFEFDKDAHTMVTKVVDARSGELIRQMPTEEVLRVSKALGKLQGLLVHEVV